MSNKQEINDFVEEVHRKIELDGNKPEAKGFIKECFEKLSPRAKKELAKSFYWCGALAAFGAEKNKGNNLYLLTFQCLIYENGVPREFEQYLDNYLTERKSSKSVYYLADVANFGSFAGTVFRSALIEPYSKFEITTEDLRFAILENYETEEKKDFYTDEKVFGKEIRNIIKISKALGAFHIGGLSVKEHGFNEISTLLGRVDNSVIKSYCHDLKKIFNVRVYDFKEENGFLRLCFNLRWEEKQENMAKILKTFVSKENIPNVWKESNVFFNIWHDVFRSQCHSAHDEQLLAKNKELMKSLLQDVISFEELEDRYMNWGFEEQEAVSIKTDNMGLSSDELEFFLKDGKKRISIEYKALALAFGAGLRTVGVMPATNLEMSQALFNEDEMAIKMSNHMLSTLNKSNDRLFEGGVKLESRKHLDLLRDVINEDNEKWDAKVHLTNEGQKISVDVSSANDIELIKKLVIHVLELDISPNSKEDSKNRVRNLLDESQMKIDLEEAMSREGSNLSQMRVKKF